MPIGEVLCVHDPCQRIAEDVRVVPVVEPPLQLFQVAVQCLTLILWKAPVERLKRLHSRCCLYARHQRPTLGRVIDGLMAGVGVTDPKVGFEVVSRWPQLRPMALPMKA